MGMCRRLVTVDQRRYLIDGEILLAILRTAIDLEWVLWAKLFFEKKINPELIDSWTLGKYINWNAKLKLVSKEQENILREFNTLRNKIVHKRIFIDMKLKNTEELEEIKKQVMLVCDFIDSFEITSDWDSEKEFTEYYQKGGKK